jgi:hypothetical protein
MREGIRKHTGSSIAVHSTQAQLPNVAGRVSARQNQVLLPRHDAPAAAANPS